MVDAPYQRVSLHTHNNQNLPTRPSPKLPNLGRFPKPSLGNLDLFHPKKTQWCWYGCRPGMFFFCLGDVFFFVSPPVFCFGAPFFFPVVYGDSHTFMRELWLRYCDTMWYWRCLPWWLMIGADASPDSDNCGTPKSCQPHISLKGTPRLPGCSVLPWYLSKCGVAHSYFE